MATRTETITENYRSIYKSTWNIQYSTSDIVINQDSFTLPPLVLTAGYTYSGKKNGFVTGVYKCSLKGNNRYGKSGEADVSGKNYIIPDNNGYSTIPISINTNNIFKSSNKDQRSITFQYTLTELYLESWRNSKDNSELYNGYDWFGTFDIFTTPPTITLDVPPTATVSDISFKINNVPTTSIYAGITYAYVNIQDAVAYYGGDVSSITLTIGSDSTSINYPNITSDQTLSTLLNTPGTFTPTITITDSRGQTKTYNVKHGTEESIIVRSYTSPSAVISVERTLLTPPGKPYDEGEYTTISMEMMMDDPIVDAVAPTIVAVDENNNIYSDANSNLSVAWYSTRASDGSLSGSVTWANVSSGETVYGLVSITGNFDPFTTYQISVTPNDTRGSGTTVTQSIATAFYTVDFLAGGHGIAFGRPASNFGFYVDMDTHLLQGADITGNVTISGTIETLDTSIDLPDYTDSGTIDNAIHDDIVSLGWENDVIPNDTPMSLKELIAKLVNIPMIIDSGTDGIWTYRKWSDGTVECWGVKSWTISSWSSWGNTYYSNYSGTIAYPTGLFNAAPTVMADGGISTGGDSWLAARGGATYGGNKDHTASYFLMRGSNGSTGETASVHIHAIGTWR